MLASSLTQSSLVFSRSAWAEVRWLWVCLSSSSACSRLLLTWDSWLPQLRSEREA